MKPMTRPLVPLALLALLAAACSSDGEDGDDAAEDAVTTTTTAPTTTTEVDRPEGPAADLSVELTGGNGVNVASPAPPDAVLEEAGYVQEEYEAAGTATTYTVDGTLSEDGRWTFRPTDTAPYRTRIVVRRPADVDAFSGTVAVEWLNVSGGLDADPDWQSLHEDLTREGDMWVGVSAQLIGVNGGPVLVTTPESEAAGAGRGLRVIDPDRYGSLEHPGDGFSFDILTQVARAVRQGGPFLGDVEAQRIIAVGESQSAFALVTYINGVQPLTQAFDGFFVHSRGASGLPLVPAGQAAGIAGAIGASPAIFRTDATTPIVDIQSETDVTGLLNSVAARQDDSDTFRLWEVAGTAHADRHLIGSRADNLGCGAINNGPLHVVAKGAYRALVTWIATGSPPPIAPRLELVSEAPPAMARDADGIALGGIRTPPVDVPVDVLSGEPGPSGSAICLLSGSTVPLPAEELAQRYPTRAEYEQRYADATDEAIAAGFVLEEDRDALLAFADPSRVPG